MTLLFWQMLDIAASKLFFRQRKSVIFLPRHLLNLKAMSFPLSLFETHLPADITQKGINYFAQGYVKSLNKEDNTWQAEVTGTHPYQVSIDVQNGNVLQWNCTCPYDHGPICKHVAAVLYSILEETLKEVVAPKTFPKRKG
ncbi:MAG: SWIM zinc finger family protein [Bacteroidota bacterium]